ncbi:hypothetical protein [Pseudobdellovibrio exovorus]|uniref:Uncharacterized protein n=1 Tax=Pseudobdellovibrio exovorus JSS TaxID=1184267 RepID=M4V7F4_9BACT|nr:hypothetical protein [Pseudobdellovibrio exovorus]AGH95327.1 hypothetical protein A11Q_1111 [Pseudobdellovibrio exovorus JSS]
MKFKNILSCLYRYNFYFVFAALWAYVLGERVGVFVEKKNSLFGWEIQSWHLGYLFIAITLWLFANIGVLFFKKDFRKHLRYSMHWTGIIFFNLLGIIFFHNDIILMSKTMFFTLVITSGINSLPIFKDTLEDKIEILEQWKPEDLVFFRGHFSKNRPAASRNPVHAAYPMLLGITFSVMVYGFSVQRQDSVSSMSLIRDIGGSKTKREIASINGGPSNKSFSFEEVKGILIISMTLTGLFVVYNHSLRTDYVNKWEILSNRHKEILSMYEQKSINAKKIEILEIQFAIDLLEMYMWGHRSFSERFNKIVREYYKTKHIRVDRKDLLIVLRTAQNQLLG